MTTMLVLATLMTCAVSAQEKGNPRAAAGDYAVTLTEVGAVISYKSEIVCIGSYFTVFNPGYKGALLSFHEGWKQGVVSVSGDGRTVTLEAKLPKGRFTYSATVSEAGVRTTIRVFVAEGEEVGPVECAAFQIPASLVQGGRVEVLNVAGITVDSQPIPAVGKRGRMARDGETLIIRTAVRNIIISSPSPMGLFPFDARVDLYGKQQGIWAFTSIPVAPGYEAVSTFELTVQPPEPPAVVGMIRIAPGVVATAVATAPNPTEREKFAADELVAYLARISGRKLERKEIAGASVPAGVIAVGRLARDANLISEQELDKVQRDGYVVKVARGRAALCGWRDVGTVYAVYALLKHLGVRFYAPGCEVVPKVANLTIPKCELRAKPFYEFRKMTGNLKLGHTPEDDLGVPHEIGEPGCIVHAAEFLVPLDKYYETNPEYFALQKDGKRITRETALRSGLHLCLSNPDVRRISTERLLMLIEKQPNRLFFGVSQGDGFAWCMCEDCKKLDAIPGVHMTDRLLDYVNHVAREVAKKYPDKRILTLAYTYATESPPTKVMPEPNVMVQYCPYPPSTNCQSHDFTCEQNKQGFENLKGWLAKCPNNMYIFDYPRGYAVHYEPFGSFYAMKQKLDFYAANGIRGIYYCGVPTTFRDLFVFVQSRLLWEPKADVERLIDEFMAAYYGRAAPHMRAYFNFLHKEVAERPVHQMCEGPNPGLVTAEFADKALEMFRRAEAAVEHDRAALYRVREEKFNLLFADLNERNPVNAKLAVSMDVFAQRLAEFARIARILRIHSLIRRDGGNVGEWLYKIARIRTKVRPWFADPLIDRLIADPVKTLVSEARWHCQKEIPGGWLVELDGFRGGHGPTEYSYECEPRRAVWIYGKNTPTPTMWATLYLDKVPPGQAVLVLVAQDDDKPGAVQIRITVNGKEIFAGPNTFRERGWSTGEFPIPPGILKPGENEIRFTTLQDSPDRYTGWFMVAECKVLFR